MEGRKEEDPQDSMEEDSVENNMQYSVNKENMVSYQKDKFGGLIISYYTSSNLCSR